MVEEVRPLVPSVSRQDNGDGHIQFLRIVESYLQKKMYIFVSCFIMIGWIDYYLKAFKVEN